MKKNKEKKNIVDSAKNITLMIVVWGIGIIVLLSAYALSKIDNSVSKIVLSDDINTQMNIYTIDTKGDSLLIESNGNFILMDTGRNDDDNNVVKYVFNKIRSSKALGKYKSLSLYLTQIDENYIGEVNDVFKTFDIDALYIQDKDIISNIKGNQEVVSLYDDIISLADKKKSEIIELSKGDEVVFGDAKLVVMGPIDGINIDDYSGSDKFTNYIDDTSLISMITVGNTKFLTTGDISSSMEEKLIKEYEKNLQADIYKLSGSGNTLSNTSEFLSLVEPNYSIKTYYENKNDNYINDAVGRVMYYSPLYSTQYNGNISINIMNDEVSVKLDNNKEKIKVIYKDDNGVKLTNKTYYISSDNTLSENWNFFIKKIDGYSSSDIEYSKTLTNITSSSYGVPTFRGIKNLKDDINIVVNYNKVLANSIYINTKEVKLNIGDSVDISANVEPVNAYVSEYIFTSDNEKVATVENGTITAHSHGKATITVSIDDSSVKAECIVIVGDYDPSIEGINLSIKNLLIDKSVRFNLSDYEDNDIVWSVSNPDILAINDDGVLQPIKNGVTVITATLNGYSDSCKVTVTDGLIVSNIKGNTSVSDMLDILKLNDAKILGSFGKYKTDEDIVATDDALVIKNDKDISVYTISVIGDVNGEGQVDSDDVSILDEYLKGNSKINKAALKAADVNVDGKINSKDRTILNNYIKHKSGYEQLPYKK